MAKLGSILDFLFAFSFVTFLFWTEIWLWMIALSPPLTFPLSPLPLCLCLVMLTSYFSVIASVWNFWRPKCEGMNKCENPDHGFFVEQIVEFIMKWCYAQS